MINTYEWSYCYNWHQFCFNEKLPYFSIMYYFEGLVQDCSNSIANELELLQSCTKPSISDEICYWNIKLWTSSYLISCDTDLHKEVLEESGMGSNSYWIIQPYQFPQYFETGLLYNWFIPDFCDNAFYDVPLTSVDKYLLLHFSYSFVHHGFLSQLICHFETIFF